MLMRDRWLGSMLMLCYRTRWSDHHSPLKRNISAKQESNWKIGED